MLYYNMSPQPNKNLPAAVRDFLFYATACTTWNVASKTDYDVCKVLPLWSHTVGDTLGTRVLLDEAPKVEV